MKSSREYAEEVSTLFRKLLLAGRKVPIEELIIDAIESAKEEVANPTPCVYHEDYQGKRQPRTVCRGCWEYYVRRKLST